MDKEEELIFLKNWSLEMIDYLFKSDRSGFKNSYIQGVEIAFEKKNLRGLRTIQKDDIEAALGLDINLQKELNQILLSKFNRDLTYYDKTNNRKFNSIIKRGKIINDEEFQLLMNRIDLIFQDKKNEEEIKQIDGLLLKYETKKKSEQ